MFKKIYATARPRNFNSSLSLKEVSLNWGYDTIFFTKWQFLDYEEAGITTMSAPIPNNRYTWTIPQIDRQENIIWTKPKLTRFIQVEYSDKFTNPTDLSNSIAKSWGDTSVIVFNTPAEAITWIKANTDLLEVSPWKFEITPAWTDPITQKPTVAKYLVIT